MVLFLFWAEVEAVPWMVVEHGTLPQMDRSVFALVRKDYISWRFNKGITRKVDETSMSIRI
jgi:hypothetical protein